MLQFLREAVQTCDCCLLSRLVTNINPLLSTLMGIHVVTVVDPTIVECLRRSQPKARGYILRHDSQRPDHSLEPRSLPQF